MNDHCEPPHAPNAFAASQPSVEGEGLATERLGQPAQPLEPRRHVCRAAAQLVLQALESAFEASERLACSHAALCQRRRCLVARRFGGQPTLALARGGGTCEIELCLHRLGHLFRLARDGSRLCMLHLRLRELRLCLVALGGRRQARRDSFLLECLGGLTPRCARRLVPRALVGQCCLVLRSQLRQRGLALRTRCGPRLKQCRSVLATRLGQSLLTLGERLGDHAACRVASHLGLIAGSLRRLPPLSVTRRLFLGADETVTHRTDKVGRVLLGADELTVEHFHLYLHRLALALHIAE